LSREFKGRKIVIYPQYLNSKLSRSEGRRIPLNIAVPNPSIDEILKAAEDLGLNPVYEDDKRYPRNWWMVKGRVIVDKKNYSKARILRMIAIKIREYRRLGIK